MRYNSANCLIVSNINIVTDEFYNDYGMNDYTPLSYFLRNINKNLFVSDNDLIDLDKIKHLKINSCSISDEILPKIYDSFISKLINVEIIDINHNPTKDIETIEKILLLPNLKYLNLTGTPLGLKKNCNFGWVPV